MQTFRTVKSLAVFAALALTASPVLAQDFAYNPPGALENGGSGRVDNTEYVPGMTFPIEGKAYANSQIYGHGGFQGPGGGQCDSNNYAYPWSDNYCEARSWSMPLCPAGKGHQGQDIRPETCAKSTHWAVAAEGGTITSIGTYSVYLAGDSGTRHRYLHLDMNRLAISRGARVEQGQRIGLVSNDFGNTATTIHLHYDLNQSVSGVGKTYVPTYMSLVRSYERQLGVIGAGCEAIPAEGGVIDDNSPCFRLQGPPTTWRRVTGIGHGGALNWTRGWQSATPGNWAEWGIDIAEAGSYRVEIWTDPSYASSQQAKYQIHAGAIDRELIHDYKSQAAGWQSLGVFEFSEGGGQWLRVFDNTGEATSLDRRIQADAIRLVPANGADPDPIVDPDPDPIVDPDPTLPPCHLGAQGGVIDDADSDCFALLGPKKYWREVSGTGVGGKLYWTKAYAGSKTSNSAEWTFYVSEDGVYRLDVSDPGSYGTSQQARWEIEHDGQRHDVRVNMANKDGWLGAVELDLKAGMPIRMRLKDNTGERSSLGRKIPADAVRAERTGDLGATPVLNVLGGTELAADSAIDEAADGKAFSADDPGVPLDGLDGGPGSACQCTTVGGGDVPAPLAPLALLLGFVGLFVARRKR